MTYTPAAGRLAAAMATIKARRRLTRDSVDRSKELTFRMAEPLGASRNNRSAKKSAQLKGGASRPACRGRSENSNASIARPLVRSGFVAASQPALVEIFSVKIRRVVFDAPV
jgi:hypothetical protein